MDLVLCWLIAPAGLLACTVGLSLLVEVLAGLRLPWGLRPGVGLAVAIVFAQFATATDTTAELAVPGIILGGALGIALGFDRPGEWPARASLLVFGLVFLLFAMPIVASGQATWPGYIKLDDTATWMAITDHVFEFGRGVGGLAPSTHQAVIDAYLGGSYPIGGFAAAAVMGGISGQDVAFTMAPSMAFAAAVMALVIFELVGAAVRRALFAAVVAVSGSLSAILVGYYLWGGVKELFAAALLPLLAAAAAWASRAGWPPRGWLPIGLAAAAIITVLGPGGSLWAFTILAPFALALLFSDGLVRAWRVTWPVVLAIVALVLPVIFTPNGVFNPVQSVLTEDTELGNLNAPLSLLHTAGIWPSMDFRFDPHLKTVIEVICVLVLMGAAVTVVLCARREDGRPLAFYVGGAALGAALVIAVGSPWVDGKSMATVSPAILTAAIAGVVILAERTPFKIETGVVAAVLILLVAWGALLAYQGVWLAPKSHYEELEEIAGRFDGQGPTLSNEVSIYGPRHFLRKLDAEGATDLRVRQVALRHGQSTDDEYVDLDQIEPTQFDPYNLVIVRRSPSESRPPADFDLAYTTPHYEVWKRGPSPGTLVDDLPLGSTLDAGAVPDCDRVAALANAVSPSGRLVAAQVGKPFTLALTDATLPPGWTLPAPYGFAPNGTGRLTVEASPSPGRYEMWLGGVVFGGLKLSVDGNEVASERGVLNNSGGLEPLGELDLSGGAHPFTFDYQGAGLEPGSGEHSYFIGPLTLEPLGSVEGLVTVAPDRYRSLCGERWDWIEAYA